MSRHVVLLRGVNVGGNSRVPMADLRGWLADAGSRDVETYVQSGNVLLAGPGTADDAAALCSRVLEDRLRLRIAALGRSRDQLAEVVALDPLAGVVTEPRTYLVTFLAEKPAAGLADRLVAAAAPEERVHIAGREIYTWHPFGAGRSKLWAFLAGKGVGTVATARNWRTVNALLERA